MLDAAGVLKSAVLNKTGASSTAIVAAVSGKRFRVISLVLSASGAATVTVEDEDGNDLIGPIHLAANSQVVLPGDGLGWNETATANKALHLLSSAAVTIGGAIRYQEIL